MPTIQVWKVMHQGIIPSIDGMMTKGIQPRPTVSTVIPGSGCSQALLLSTHMTYAYCNTSLAL
jgi:hypothetical protein